MQTVNGQRPLTPDQKKVLDFINVFLLEKGYPPSLSEIARHFRKSIGTAQHFVRELREKEYLLNEESVSRGNIPSIPDSKEIFLLGQIAAGEPIEPIENPEPIMAPRTFMQTPGNYYALKVKGDSMVEDGIIDGDTVIIKHQNTALNGDTVVAITENGATLKIFRNKNGKIYLEPRNHHLNNIYPKELEIRGKFCGLIRNNL